MSKYPIELIEADFIQKRMPFLDITNKYGISKPTLSYYSKKLDWMKKRKKFNTQLRNKVMKVGIDKGVKEQKSLIDRLQTLLDLKLACETKVFLSTKELKKSKITDKETMYLLNKSKDPVGELTKIIELLKGNATGRVEINAEEKSFRYNRLKEQMVAN